MDSKLLLLNEIVQFKYKISKNINKKKIDRLININKLMYLKENNYIDITNSEINYNYKLYKKYIDDLSDSIPILEENIDILIDCMNLNKEDLLLYVDDINKYNKTSKMGDNDNEKYDFIYKYNNDVKYLQHEHYDELLRVINRDNIECVYDIILIFKKFRDFFNYINTHSESNLHYYKEVKNNIRIFNIYSIKQLYLKLKEIEDLDKFMKQNKNTDYYFINNEFLLHFNSFINILIKNDKIKKTRITNYINNFVTENCCYEISISKSIKKINNTCSRYFYYNFENILNELFSENEVDNIIDCFKELNISTSGTIYYDILHDINDFSKQMFNTGLFDSIKQCRYILLKLFKYYDEDDEFDLFNKKNKRIETCPYPLEYKNKNKRFNISIEVGFDDFFDIIYKNREIFNINEEYFKRFQNYYTEKKYKISKDRLYENFEENNKEEKSKIKHDYNLNKTIQKYMIDLFKENIETVKNKSYDEIIKNNVEQMYKYIGNYIKLDSNTNNYKNYIKSLLISLITTYFNKRFNDYSKEEKDNLYIIISKIYLFINFYINYDIDINKFLEIINHNNNNTNILFGKYCYYKGNKYRIIYDDYKNVKIIDINTCEVLNVKKEDINIIEDENKDKYVKVIKGGYKGLYSKIISYDNKGNVIISREGEYGKSNLEVYIPSLKITKIPISYVRIIKNKYKDKKLKITKCDKKDIMSVIEILTCNLNKCNINEKFIMNTIIQIINYKINIEYNLDNKVNKHKKEIIKYKELLNNSENINNIFKIKKKINTLKKIIKSVLKQKKIIGEKNIMNKDNITLLIEKGKIKEENIKTNSDIIKLEEIKEINKDDKEVEEKTKSKVKIKSLKEYNKNFNDFLSLRN